jgi:hypothetical protein
LIVARHYAECLELCCGCADEEAAQAAEYVMADLRVQRLLAGTCRAEAAPTGDAERHPASLHDEFAGALQAMQDGPRDTVTSRSGGKR